MSGLLRKAAGSAAVAGAVTAVGRRIPAPRTAPSTTDLVDQLRALGQLRTDGLLTEEEFATQKARILAG